MGVLVPLLKLLHLDHLICLLIFVIFILASMLLSTSLFLSSCSQGILDKSLALWIQGVRELNFEVDEQVSKGVNLLVERHTHILNHLDFVMFEYFSWVVLYSDFFAI